MTRSASARRDVRRSVRRRSPLGWLTLLGAGLVLSVVVAARPWVARKGFEVDQGIAAELGGHAYAMNTGWGHRARRIAVVTSWRDGNEGFEWIPVGPLPGWLPAAPFVEPGRFGLERVTSVEAYGRPFYGLYAVRGAPTTPRGPAWVYRRALVVPSPVGWADELVLPFGVLWPGFIANLAVWTLAALAVAEAAALIRRARRRAKGCCAWCGYDLSDGAPPVCPECGSARPAPGAGGGNLA